MERATTSEFVVEGATYFIEFKIDWERIDVMLVVGEDLSCYFVSNTLSGMRPSGFKLHSYRELLKKALSKQDIEETNYAYEIKKGKRTVDFAIRFKMKSGASKDGGKEIFLTGASLSLNKVPDRISTIAEYIRRQAITSGLLSAMKQENKNLESERNKYRNLAETAETARLASEQGLLQSCVKVVNEKKIKLRSLMSEAEVLENENSELKNKLLQSDNIITDLRKQLETQQKNMKALALQRNQEQPLQDGSGSSPSKLRPPKAKLLDDSAQDTYPDFNVVNNAPSTPVSLFNSSAPQLERSYSDTSKGSGGSRQTNVSSVTHLRKRPKPDGDGDPNYVTAQELLEDSD
eukprot:TRINITY_DN2924_c1_g1_i1.p1 TRINITY_DN2924_c1_g1~~TRINITY_DN2924_c1_g1_i1.p1  ORF type:complete len:348 (+),score=63.93 TRINITY_DN2924_c1_g1_i1:42-1085(+)